MNRNYGDGGSSSSDPGGSSSASYNKSSSSSAASQVPIPLDGSQQTGPPPFLTKTYDIVDNQSTNNIISWSSSNNSFVVWDPQAFSMTLLPRFFKHNNFSSFVRQLNTYGFRKVDPDRWEFANEGFLRGQKHLLNNIRRRRTSGATTSQTPFPLMSQQSIDSCVEVGLFGSLDKEIDRLKRDKQLLMMELVKIRQQQQSNKTYLQSMEERLRGTEAKQQQLMGFLAKAIRNPTFMQQLIQQREVRKNKLLLAAANKRRHIDQGTSSTSHHDDVMVIKPEPLEDQYINFETPNQQLNMMLGMNMQPTLSNQERQVPYKQAGDDNDIQQEGLLDQVFWEEFLNDNTRDDDLTFLGAAEGDDHNQDDEENPFDQFGDPCSSPR